MTGLAERFGSMVFNDAVMRARLPKETYQALHKTIDDGKRLNPEVASVVANAMKDWAIEKGATHFTHWFQPMTGITAEKHDSFITPIAGGAVVLEFAGKELIRGESDASSFPSGGLRATFEARGYTSWDPTSYAFIKENTLYIPTAFCSHSGEALDKKTPLLRSMEAVNRQALRILRLFPGNAVTRVIPTVGPEQEYFLVDRGLFERRLDLIYTGHTLFGARAPKGQELEDHYFGALKPRVAAFMRELDEELWKLGVPVRTEHNEVAPSQHELAPIFETNNIAADHNQLTMEMMKRVAARHGLCCLLHEKPYAGLNGSGKHNNWSLLASTGANLLEPGETPYENAQFLLFLVAVIQAVDDYQDLLRASVASAGNDYRLGGMEAPPAIISMYIGSELEDILTSIETGASYAGVARSEMAVGVHVLPRFPTDTTDRNRTSPIAFTGNKFEFRMVGSSASISDANVVLNTAVAESLRQYADELEGAEDFQGALHALIRRVITAHKRIVYHGNNYAGEWVREAERRGLLNLPSAVDALPRLLAQKNVELFARHRIFSMSELTSRYEIKMENYVKITTIEANTMIDMAARDIMPAVSRWMDGLAETVMKRRAVGAGYSTKAEERRLARGCELNEAFDAALEGLMAVMSAAAAGSEDVLGKARVARERILPAMAALRAAADALETAMGREYWPMPTYGDLLFSE